MLLSKFIMLATRALVWPGDNAVLYPGNRRSAPLAGRVGVSKNFAALWKLLCGAATLWSRDSWFEWGMLNEFNFTVLSFADIDGGNVQTQ